MNLGAPRMLLHAAGVRHNPELDHHQPSQQPDPVERTVVVDEPTVPDHVGDLAGEPVAPGPEGAATDGPAVPDDLSELFEGPSPDRPIG